VRGLAFLYEIPYHVHNFLWRLTMTDIKSSLEKLKQSIAKLKPLSEELHSIVNEEKVPRNGLRTDLIQAFDGAIEAEKNLLLALKAIDAVDLNPGDASFRQYDKIYSDIAANIAAKTNTARIKTDLGKFVSIFSDEAKYDEAISEYREKAALLAASIEADGSKQNDTEPYLK
jgi:hypothetical protein